MRNNRKDQKPNLKPVTKIELSEEHRTLRIVLAVGFLVIGVAAIVVGLVSLLNTENGWQEVQISTKSANCAGDFVLMYDFSDAGAFATAVNKQLTTLYSQTAEDAYRLFSADLREDGLQNVRYLNDHVGEVVTVDPAHCPCLSSTTADIPIWHRPMRSTTGYLWRRATRRLPVTTLRVIRSLPVIFWILQNPPGTRRW